MSTDTIIFEELLPKIKAIPAEKVLSLNMPMNKYLLEAADLGQWSANDLKELAIAGITQETLDDLTHRRIAAGIAQTNWEAVLHAREEAQKQWKMESEEGFALRDELVHYMRFAFRKDGELMRRLRKIAEGTSNADMISDLRDLSLLGQEHLYLLQKLQFDVSRLELAEQMYNELSTVHGDSKNDSGRENDIKLIRDKAYTHLKALVDDIREAGQFVFWKNPIRREGYASDYFRKKKSPANETAAPGETGAAAVNE